MSLEVKAYKLTNGLEIIGKEASVTDTMYKIEDAFFLHANHSEEDGSINVEYVPMTILGKPTGKTHMGFDVNLPATSVIFSYELNPGIVQRYQQYVSPIDLSQATTTR